MDAAVSPRPLLGFPHIGIKLLADILELVKRLATASRVRAWVCFSIGKTSAARGNVIARRERERESERERERERRRGRERERERER